MTWLSNLIRPDLNDLTAYSSARSEAKGFAPDISIDANEFPWSPFGYASTLCKLNRYPDQQPPTLVRKLETLWNVPSGNLLVTRGSDEGIDLLIRLLCRFGTDNILICPPTYGMYTVAAKIQGVDVLKVSMAGNGQLDVKGILDACKTNTKLIFIPCPHAPMGHRLRTKDILELCKGRSERTLLVIDEAYVEFSDDPQGMIPYIKDYPNLVILRTLSKAHALAGERIGVVIGPPQLILALACILAPYPLTQTSILSALEALSPCGLIQSAERKKIIIEERKRMARLLLESPFIVSVYPSVSNFLLARTQDAKAVMERLKSIGILARDRSNEIPDAVRFSISTPEENNLVLKALDVTVEHDDTTKEQRLYTLRRKTKETNVEVAVNLDKPNFLMINTGIGFFDHMLEQIATHGGFGLSLTCRGDLNVDTHHSIEDCALALGTALRSALGNKRGIGRYGFTTPLDEALALVAIDLSGRPVFTLTGTIPRETIGDMPSEMTAHFFQSLSVTLEAAIHIEVKGENAHHIIEAAFKATGRALRQAIRREGTQLPSTKGVL